MKFSFFSLHYFINGTMLILNFYEEVSNSEVSIRHCLSISMQISLSELVALVKLNLHEKSLIHFIFFNIGHQIFRNYGNGF